MINTYFETDFKFEHLEAVLPWISKAVQEEQKKEGEINYIFVNDDYLFKLNVEFLEHDTLTDIITFDNSVGNILHSDIYISVERVQENAKDYGVSFNEELHRVMIHGVLHLCGYKDKSEGDIEIMRERENYYLSKLI